MEPKIWVDSSVKYFHQVPLLCTVSLLVLAYTKQGFEGVGLCQDKAHKLMVQGWRQAVWQEVVHARRCCSSTGIDPVVSVYSDGGRQSLQAEEMGSGWEWFWV